MKFHIDNTHCGEAHLNKVHLTPSIPSTQVLNLKHVKHFILDECDKMLEALDMRRDVQEIFRMTPHEKQVMMFSATLNKEMRVVCKKFMQDPMEVRFDIMMGRHPPEASLTSSDVSGHVRKCWEI